MMWAVLAVLSAVGAAILGTREVLDIRGRGKRRKIRLVFRDVSANHSVQAFFAPNHKER